VFIFLYNYLEYFSAVDLFSTVRSKPFAVLLVACTSALQMFVNMYILLYTVLKQEPVVIGLSK